MVLIEKMELIEKTVLIEALYLTSKIKP